MAHRDSRSTATGDGSVMIQKESGLCKCKITPCCLLSGTTSKHDSDCLLSCTFIPKMLAAPVTALRMPPHQQTINIIITVLARIVPPLVPPLE